MLFTHGFIYFLRDDLLRQIEGQRAAGTSADTLAPFYARLHSINSKIEVHEASHATSETSRDFST